MSKWKKYFNREDPNMPLIILILAAVSVVTVLLASGLGPVSVPPGTTARILVSKVPVLGNGIAVTWEQLDRNIVLGLRLPRVCLGMVVGASLAVCGVTMLFGVFSFLGIYSLSISAFIGSAITIIFVYVISRVRGRINITQLLLSGVAISMIMDGVTSIIKLSAPNALGLHNAEFWMSGSLAGAKWAYLKLPFGVLVLCMVFLMINYRGLNLLLLGDENAGALGVNVRRLQKELVLLAYMADHNRHHAEELAEMGGKLRSLGNEAAADKIAEGVKEFTKANELFAEALKLVQQ